MKLSVLSEINVGGIMQYEYLTNTEVPEGKLISIGDGAILVGYRSDDEKIK